MFSLETFHKNYQTETRNLAINQRKFSFLVPQSIDRFIDPQDLFNDFPLWSKIWHASMILAGHIISIKPEQDRQFLEIGCGLGIVGIIASSFGHRVTMTEYNQDALNFARANAATNLSKEDQKPEIKKLDWKKPELKGTFDYIIGSEIIYNERDFQPILMLFERYLKPSGEIILAEGIRKTSMEFFRQMDEFFEITARKKVLRSGEEETRIILSSMKFKNSSSS